MKRREFMKKLGIMFGAVVAAPKLLMGLGSGKAKKKSFNAQNVTIEVNGEEIKLMPNSLEFKCGRGETSSILHIDEDGYYEEAK